MQAEKKTVAVVAAAAGNVDATFQRSTLADYAKKYNFEVDRFFGERSPSAGAAAEPEYRDLINEIKSGGVGQLLILSDVRHAVPEEVLEECRRASVTVKFVDVQQESGLGQTP